MKRPEQWFGVDAASALTDDSGQMVLHALQLVEGRRQCATQEGVAVVESGSDNAASDGQCEVIGQQTAHMVHGEDVTRVAVEPQVRVDGHAERLELRRDRPGAACDVDSGDGGG